MNKFWDGPRGIGGMLFVTHSGKAINVGLQKDE
jgi:hypothetical protein